MKVTPRTEAELNKFDPLPPGVYPFTVMESDQVLSKSVKNAGKPMVKLKLNVHGPQFDTHIYDYFADWFSEWKLKHFCESVGIEDDYQNGEVDPVGNAWQGKDGFVVLDIEKAQGNYAEKNVVKDYKENDDDETETQAPAPAPKPVVKPETAAAAVQPPDDDVPF